MKTHTIIAIVVAYSAACYSAPHVLASSLDCSHGSIKVSATYRPQDSSHSPIRLSCSGTRAVVVRDGITYGGFE